MPAKSLAATVHYIFFNVKRLRPLTTLNISYNEESRMGITICLTSDSEPCSAYTFRTDFDELGFLSYLSCESVLSYLMSIEHRALSKDELTIIRGTLHCSHTFIYACLIKMLYSIEQGTMITCLLYCTSLL